MNEIRMHVERLFQDKVLSEENIELKEEIYGNLVARYEDYVASGMSEEEALAKTKESITSVEDVLQDAHKAEGPKEGGSVATGVPQGASEGSSSPSGPSAEAQASSRKGIDDDVSHMPTVPLSQSGDAPTNGECAVPGDPVPPIESTAVAAEGLDAKKTDDPHKKWLPYAIIAAVVVCVIAIAVVVSSCIDDAADDREDAARANATAVENDAQASAGTAQDSTGQAASDAQGVEDAIVISEDGAVRYDGEPADDLLMAVVNSDSATLATHTPLSLSSAQDIEAALRDLPLSDWLTSFDAAGKTSSLAVSYEAIPERFDGDSIDAALVYNAAALMCASSEIDTINVSVTDADDVRENDRPDSYVFTRQMMEEQFGMALTNDLVNDEGWDTLKEGHLYTNNFIDRTLDRAERN